MRLTVAGILPLIGIVITCFAIEESQTDWSGGWSVSGPVADWATSFLSNDRTDFSSPGILTLSQMPEYFEIDSTPTAYQIFVDMDQDSDNDLIIWGADWSICWLENIQGGTSWISHTINTNSNESYITSLAIADLNSDDDIDVVVAWNEPGAEIAWLENPGTDGPAPWQMHIIDPDGYPSYLGVGDIDLDGDPDVIGATSKTGNLDCVVWWENFGQGSNWSKKEIDDEYSYPCKVAVLDLIYGDSVELICYRHIYPSSNWELVIFRYNGWDWYEIIVSSSSKYASGQQISAVDINLDGNLDMVSYEQHASQEDSRLVWYEQITYNSWERHVIYSEDSDLSRLTLGVSDLDGDGDDDIFALRGGTSAIPSVSGIWWWENDGSGSAWNMHHVAWGFCGSNIGSADISLDGNQNLVTNILFACTPSLLGIKWWDLTAENGYYDEGELVSSVLDTGAEPSWQYIDWYSDPIPLTSVDFRVRGGSTAVDLGEWSASITAPMTSLENYLDDGDRYIQYKAILSTEHETITPVLQDVSFHYWPVALEENQVAEITDYSLEVSGSNPSCSGTVSISFSIPVSAHVQMDVFDLSGRVTQELADTEFVSGEHTVQATGLSAGVYLCRLQSNSFSDSIRFVILD
ncbi:MAG: T9SS type A sorting domain-containing protein [Candidatus Sabulitectum sp.]|nr:T9SS type A sorting domain-containing protein [Candidatus Sabulitectum sp.]